MHSCKLARWLFQPTLPARGATSRHVRHRLTPCYFNPRSPHGERRVHQKSYPRRRKFQPTLPARGATHRTFPESRSPGISTHAPRTGSDGVLQHLVPALVISTHAPRTGSDGRRTRVCSDRSDFNPRSPHGERRADQVPAAVILAFQPTLPARGATALPRREVASHGFQPTLPARGATRKKASSAVASTFQPTLPARGATPATPGRPASPPISTHAPRTGSDAPGIRQNGGTKVFQPTLPARGATRSGFIGC